MNMNRQLTVAVDSFQLTEPFHITGNCFDRIETVTVSITQDGMTGRGEAAGVYYHGENARGMARAIAGHRQAIEGGASRADLLELLPPGGVRNALDAALWDLDAQLQGIAVWQVAGLDAPRPLLTTFTCGAGTPDAMAAKALSFSDARAIKLKLTGEEADSDRVRAVRNALPNVWLAIDANQGFTWATLDRLMPELVDCNVSLIEQPFPIGQEALLDGLESPIPIAADESAQSTGDIAKLVGRFDMVNIKLDKCGGLTEGLAMAGAARAHGLDVMVGCMAASSLALAPAFILGQLCDMVDLDAPAMLKTDRNPALAYRDGHVSCPPALWGNGKPRADASHGEHPTQKVIGERIGNL